MEFGFLVILGSVADFSAPGPAQSDPVWKNHAYNWVFVDIRALGTQFVAVSVCLCFRPTALMYATPCMLS